MQIDNNKIYTSWVSPELSIAQTDLVVDVTESRGGAKGKKMAAKTGAIFLDNIITKTKHVDTCSFSQDSYYFVYYP